MANIIKIVKGNSYDSFNELKKYLTTVHKMVIKESEDLFLVTSGSEDIIATINGIEKDITSEANGIIFNKKTMNVVCYSFDKVEDLNEDDKLCISSIEKFEEGTYIRLYYYDDKWVCSTLKTIDCSKTFIPMNKNTKKDEIRCNNYTKLFMKIANQYIDFQLLQKCNTYSFVLKHEENRCLIKHEGEPELIYNGYCNNDTLESFFHDDVKNLLLKTPVSYSNIIKNLSCPIRNPISLHTYDFDSIKDEIENKNEMSEKGYIIYIMKNGIEEKKKMIYKNYTVIQTVRGTNPNIYIRYLELNEEERIKLACIFKDYDFNKIENDIVMKTIEIFNVYKMVFMFREINLDNVNYRIKKSLIQLHAYFLRTRNVITYEMVYNKLTQLRAPTLAWVLEWI